MEGIVHALGKGRLMGVIVDDVETRLDGLDILQREDEPAAQHTSAHGCGCAVDDAEQRHTVVLHGLQQFERTYGELVEAHITLLLYA